MQNRQHLVVIDPGHGGSERVGGSSPNNAIAPNGLMEKDLTLDMAQRVRDTLSSSNIEVMLTRDQDTNLALEARAHVARDNEAALFLSIHFNGFRDPSVDGTVTFTGRGASESSQQFAQVLQAAVVAVTGVRDRGVRSRNFGVIMPGRHHPDTASVLLEVAFLTNPEQAERLTQDDYKTLIADAIVSAIRTYMASTSHTKSVVLSGHAGTPGSRTPVVAEDIPLAPEAGGRSIVESALETGDIIVSTTTEAVSGLIAGVSGSQVSHAALYVGDGMVVEAIGGGVMLTTLQQALEDDSFAVALRYPGLTEEQKLMIRDFAGQHLDSGYDYVGIARHALFRLAGVICNRFEGTDRVACEAGRYMVSFGNDDADRWYCSELVFAAYEHAGASLGLLPQTSTPGTIVSLNTILEYVGHLKSYPGEHGELQASGSKGLALNLQQASKFGLGGDGVVIPMSVYRSAAMAGNFGGTPARSLSEQGRSESAELYQRNHETLQQYSGMNVPQQSRVASTDRFANVVARQYCAGDHVRQDDAATSLAEYSVPETGIVHALELNLVPITRAGSYRLAYDRIRNLGYGVIEQAPGRDNRNFRGTTSLQDALNTWATYIPTVMAAPNYILTGGVYVDKPGEHGRGNAIDIDGFWWSDTDKFLANDAPTDWHRYLTIEATLRKAFGTVLNYDYNSAHHDHWHCDLGRNTNWRRVSSQSYFAQRALNEIWGENLSVDGNWGNLSSTAASRNGYDFSTTGSWDHFLDDIINQQSTTLVQQNSVINAARFHSLDVDADNVTSQDAVPVQQTEILNQQREYTDPSNFPVNLPEPGGSVDQFELVIPQGLQFSYVDIKFVELSPLAKAEIIQSPQQGATGRQVIKVRWTHPPYGKITYLLRAYASLDGQPEKVRVLNDSPGFDLRTKTLVKQNVPVEYIIRGNKAKLLDEAMRQLKREDGSPATQTQAIITTAVVIALIVAAVVVVGMLVLYGILHEAMERGYDVKDTKYKAAVGEGASRQEHEMVFNLDKPG